MVLFGVAVGVFAGEQDTITSKEVHYSEDSLQIGRLKRVVSSDLMRRQAIPYARRGLKLARKQGNLKEQLFFTSALGDIYRDLSISDEAIGYYLQALSFARITEDTTELIRSYNALSELYIENNLPGKADKLNNKAVNLMHPKWGYAISGKTYEIKGRINLRKDELFKARDYFVKALQKYQQAGNLEGVIRQKILTAQVYERSMLYNQALSMLHEVEGAMGQLDSRKLQSRTYRNIARLFKKQRRYEDALEYIRKAEKLPPSEKHFSQLVRTYKLKSSILEHMGNQNEALASYKKYMALTDSLDKRNTKQEILKLEVMYRAREQRQKNERLEAEVARQRELRDIFILIALGALLTAATIYAFFRYKQQQKKSRSLSYFNKQLEERVSAKTRELEIEMEERIKKTNEAIHARKKAEESDKLKTEFLNNISHEVRTPMNRIMGFSDLLLDEAPSLQVEDYAKVIYNDSKRLLKLITDLIELSKLRSENMHPDKEVFDLEKHLETVYRKYEKQCPSQLSFRINVPGSLSEYSIYSDKGRLEKILGHLIENAFKFTQSGWVELGVKNENASSIQIYVSDTGKGIDKATTRFIFDYFWQGEASKSREKAGIGAGLTIVKHLTEILGGTVSLHSVEGQGTVFKLDFPKDRLKSQSKNSEDYESVNLREKYHWSGKKILILDNRKSNMQFLSAPLEQSGAEVKWLQTEDEAIRYLASEGDMDLVILNEVFDDQHASKIVPRLKSIRYTLPVIIQRSDQLDEAPWEAGADEIVTKPVSHRVLMEKVARLLKF